MRMFKAIFILFAITGTVAIHAEATPPPRAPLAKIGATVPGPQVPFDNYNGLGRVEQVTLTADKDQVITAMKIEVRMDGSDTTSYFTVDHPKPDQIVEVGTRVQWSDQRHGFYVFH